MTVEDALAENEDRLMAIPGVVGVGIGERVGQPVISIMVRELTPELKMKLPNEVAGFSTRVDVVGEVSAF